MCAPAEKGVCISTVSLWILLVYTEASLRLKDLKTSNANLSHLFAAHWYRYQPVFLKRVFFLPDYTNFYFRKFPLSRHKALVNK